MKDLEFCMNKKRRTERETTPYFLFRIVTFIFFIFCPFFHTHKHTNSSFSSDISPIHHLFFEPQIGFKLEGSFLDCKSHLTPFYPLFFPHYFGLVSLILFVCSKFGITGFSMHFSAPGLKFSTAGRVEGCSGQGRNSLGGGI